MRKSIPALFVFMLLTVTLEAQTNHSEIAVTEKFIWVITGGGLQKYDKTTGKRLEKNGDGSNRYFHMTKDHQGNLVFSDSNHDIWRRHEQTNKTERMAGFKGSPHGMVLDSRDNIYFITDKGIVDEKTGKVYFSNISLNSQIRSRNNWGNPYCYYIDKQDRIWLGFGYGEWGGNLFIFDTVSKTFLTPDLNDFEIALWPIKSFFEDNDAVYASAGLEHMRTKGIIVKFDNLKASVLLESHEKMKDGVMASGEYIGPATFSPADSSIWFYSQNGVFKGNKNKDLSKLENWQLIFKPQFKWEYGQPYAVGSPMNATRLIAIDKTRFVLLSVNDGAVYYDGTHVKKLE
jgi:ligand-binding sensor domain-containing protein